MAVGARLDGQVAIVTGSAQGSGRRWRRGWTRRGASVVGFDLQGSPRVDVSDEGSVRSAVEAELAEHQRIDVLVNNAGIYPHAAFEEPTADA
jgi:NAD(P)-dependent dehydrogenase (short-subunit alcohol dehydrogenase family)